MSTVYPGVNLNTDVEMEITDIDMRAGTSAKNPENPADTGTVQMDEGSDWEEGKAQNGENIQDDENGENGENEVDNESQEDIAHAENETDEQEIEIDEKMETDEKAIEADEEMETKTTEEESEANKETEKNEEENETDEAMDTNEEENEADDEETEEETFEELIQRIVQEGRYEEALELIILNKRKIEDDEAEEAYKLSLNDSDKKGDTVLLQAIRDEDPNLVRFLIEIGVDITIKDATGLTPHALALTTKLKDKPKLMQLLVSKNQTTDTKEISSSNSKGEDKILFSVFNDMNARFCQAIVKNDMDEIEYLIYIKKLLLKVGLFKEQFNNNDAVICAIKNQKIEILECLLINMRELYYCHNCMVNLACNDVENCQCMSLNRVDAEGELPLTCAIQLEHALPFVKLLIDYGALESAKTSAGETPLDRAISMMKKDIIAYLHKTMRKKARGSLKTIPPGPLDLDCFVEEYEGQLIPAAKAYCLLAHHNTLKNNDPKLFVAINKAALLHALNLFDKAKEGTELTFIFKFLKTETESDDHVVTIKAEKYEKRNHIIFIDSVIRDNNDLADDNTSDNDSNVDYCTKFLDMLENDLDDFGADRETHFYLATTRTQTDNISCGVCSIKTSYKATRSPKLSQELHNGKHITKSMARKSGIIVHKFVLPPRFAQITRSPTELSNLISFYSNKKDFLAANCEGLQAYALKPRKLGKEEFLPITVPNNQFVSDEETPGVSPFVQKGITIDYYLRKIRERILPKMLKRYTIKELCSIILHYDAANLQLTNDNELVPGHELKIKGEARFTPGYDLKSIKDGQPVVNKNTASMTLEPQVLGDSRKANLASNSDGSNPNSISNKRKERNETTIKDKENVNENTRLAKRIKV